MTTQITKTSTRRNQDWTRQGNPGAFFHDVLLIGPAYRVFDELRQIRLAAERDGAPVPPVSSAPGWDGRKA